MLFRFKTLRLHEPTATKEQDQHTNPKTVTEGRGLPLTSLTLSLHSLHSLHSLFHSHTNLLTVEEGSGWLKTERMGLWNACKVSSAGSISKNEGSVVSLLLPSARYLSVLTAARSSETVSSRFLFRFNFSRSRHSTMSLGITVTCKQKRKEERPKASNGRGESVCVMCNSG